MDIQPIFLPCCFETGATIIKKQAGIESPISEAEIRKVRFYSIDGISQYWEDDKDTGYSEIYSSGNVFICAMKPEDVDKKIISLSYGRDDRQQQKS